MVVAFFSNPSSERLSASHNRPCAARKRTHLLDEVVNVLLDCGIVEVELVCDPLSFREQRHLVYFRYGWLGLERMRTLAGRLRRKSSRRRVDS